MRAADGGSLYGPQDLIAITDERQPRDALPPPFLAAALALGGTCSRWSHGSVIGLVVTPHAGYEAITVQQRCKFGGGFSRALDRGRSSLSFNLIKINYTSMLSKYQSGGSSRI